MRKGYRVETSHITHETPDGNKITREYTKTVHFDPKADPFYMTFLSFVSWMYEIRGSVALNVMAKLMEIAEYNTGIVSLSTAARKRIMTSMNISASAFTRALNLLVEKKALWRTECIDKKTGEVTPSKGEYQINPEMFWKGELKKREQLIVEFSTRYNDDDTFAGDIVF